MLSDETVIKRIPGLIQSIEASGQMPRDRRVHRVLVRALDIEIHQTSAHGMQFGAESFVLVDGKTRFLRGHGSPPSEKKSGRSMHHPPDRMACRTRCVFGKRSFADAFGPGLDC